MEASVVGCRKKHLETKMKKCHGGWIFVTELISVGCAVAAGVQERYLTMIGFGLITFILFIITMDENYL